MDEEVQQGGVPDVATGDFDQVMAAAVQGKYDQPQGGGNEGGTQAAASDPGGETPGVATPQPEAQTTTPTPEASQAKPEDYERKYHSVAGNNAQLQAQLRQQQAQFAEAQAQLQRQQADFQRQQAQAQEEMRIRMTLPADEADVAVNEYRQRERAKAEQQDFTQGAEGYRQYLLQEHQRVEQVKVDLFRQSLPQMMPDFARFIAKESGAPEEALVEIAATEPFQKMLAMVSSQRDLDYIGEALAAVAVREAQRDAARKQGNAREAVAAGTFRSDVEGVSRSNGLDLITQIKTESDADFDKRIERLTREAHARR